MARVSILAGLLLAALGLAAGQEPKPSYLVLKLGWAPEYCTTNANRTAPFCGGTQPFGAFRINRLYGADANGKDLTGCKGAAFSGGKVPSDLRPQLDCVWASYAVPYNNEQLWSSIWSEANEGGLCTGLSQGQWMRLALQLRDRYSLDAPLFESSLGSGSTSGADIGQAVVAAYGKQPHIACRDGAPKALSSVSLCFKPGSFELVDCPAAWKSDCQGPLAASRGPLPSAACIDYYPGVRALLPAAAAAPSPSLAPQLAQPPPSPATQPPPVPSPAQPAQPMPPVPSPSPSPSPSPALPSPAPASPVTSSPPTVAAPSQTEAGVAGSPVASSGSSSSGSSSSGGISTGAGVGMAVGIAAAIVGAAGVGAYWYLRKPRAAAAADEVGSGKLGSKADLEAGSEAGASGRSSSEVGMPAGRSSSWSPGHTYTAAYRYT